VHTFRTGQISQVSVLCSCLLAALSERDERCVVRDRHEARFRGQRVHHPHNTSAELVHVLQPDRIPASRGRGAESLARRPSRSTKEGGCLLRSSSPKGFDDGSRWGHCSDFSCWWASSHSPRRSKARRVRWVNSNRLDSCVSFPRLQAHSFGQRALPRLLSYMHERSYI